MKSSYEDDILDHDDSSGQMEVGNRVFITKQSHSILVLCSRRFIFHIVVNSSYGDDILDHDVGGGQAGSQQVRHHVDDLLVQLWKP